ncbi:non-homologous end-joining DNA ligase [Actinoplanes sp. CA-142083]|uniref:non-homologous end-joining DNA ligase n=1 Tax=Actinoplanes sp. CA-142083 TaxID=3239903 RepID=UPI003D8C089B
MTFSDVVPPMLATLGALPSGGDWAYEYKWDGVRAVVYVDGDDVRILSRNERDVIAAYPDVAGAIPRGGTLILDGEIVAPDAHGRPSFARLQRRMGVHDPSADLMKNTPLHYNVFDLLHEGKKSLVTAPYTERRARLEALEGLQLTPSFLADTPDDVVAESRRLGLEGVIAKRLAAPYAPGRRSPDWIKAPFIRTQEVVILGFKEGEGRRAGTIGALLVGLYRGGELSFAGGVGTGFTDAALHALQAQLKPLITAEPAAGDVPRRDAKGAIWVEPSVVGEVEYRSFTDDGRLRHSSWRGLRPDRRPEEAKVS